MKLARRLSYLFLAIAAGCASLGIPTPATFNERVAAAQTSVNAVIESTQALLRADRITAADAKNIVAMADNVVAGLDIARTVNRTDPAGASTKLTATLQVLTALQTYLASKKGTP